jgi:toxin-antitoxin system, antitoxin component, xre family
MIPANKIPAVNQRIRNLIDTNFNGSVRAFCIALGFNESQKVNRLFKIDPRNGKYPTPSIDILNLISTKLDISLSWLQTGKGDIPHNNTEQDSDTTISSGKVIPYYDAEVAAGTNYAMEMAQTTPVGMIEIGGLLKDSEFAMRVYGNSMVPNYPAGCVIGLRQYNEHFIEPGTVYVIETEENRFLKRLYYSKDKKAFRCMSDNHMKHETGPMEGEYFYPEFEIPFEDVRRLLRVTGVVKRNIM